MAKAKKQESTEPKSAAESVGGSKTPKSAASAKAAPVALAKEKTSAAAPSGKVPAAKGAKAAVGGKGSKSASPQAAAGAPTIQTSFAAEVAAKMIAQRATGVVSSSGTVPTQSAPRPESSTFKNLKQNLAKPSLSGLGGLLGTTQQPKKSNQNYGGGGQIGGGQTAGGASKLNLPRRTGG